MSSRTINVIGKVPKLKESDSRRLAVYVMRGNNVLAKAPIQADGSYRFNLARAAVSEKSAYGLSFAVAPASAGGHLDHLPNVPRTPINREALLNAEKEFRASELQVSEEILRIWWGWCRQYCVSGTVTGPDNCPAPGAEVTVYDVSYTGQGYSKVPRATVTTKPDGTFTACFEWCTCNFCSPCWPCWPIWWECWPWWWEWDMLHVIDVLERQIVPHGPGPVENLASKAALIRPDGRSLARGQGFNFARTESFAPNTQRTTLIKTKLADARLRSLFPWHWWCCDDPNVLFTVKQNGNVIVGEDPAFDTRWCFEEGSSVTLVGNTRTSTVCNSKPKPDSGFVWTNVGSLDVSNIGHDDGYANPGLNSDEGDAAFAGTLDLYGQFAAASTVSYYQVEAAQLSGNPARVMNPTVGSPSPVEAQLEHTVYIYNADGTFNSNATVIMGPFNQGGLTGLYATPQARQAGPTPPGLPDFPAVPAGGAVYWDKQGLMLSSYSSDLINGALTGAVDLTVNGYTSSLVGVNLTPDDRLRLMIDNTPLTTHNVNSVVAYNADNTLATQTGTGDCPAYNISAGGYVLIDVTVQDVNGHLSGYYVNAEWGHGHELAVTPPGIRGYRSNPLVNGGDPNVGQKSWIGGQEIMKFSAASTGAPNPLPDCCYEFRLRAAKRVTNGYGGGGFADYDFQTISLKFS